MARALAAGRRGGYRTEIARPPRTVPPTRPLRPRFPRAEELRAPVPRAVVLAPEAGGWLVFREPVATLLAASVAQVRPLLAAVAQRVEAERLWAVGFVAYEAAPAFDPALVAPAADPQAGLPLARFELFAAPAVVPGTAAALAGDTSAGDAAGEPALGYETGPWKPSIDQRAYRAALAEVRRRIAAGDTYQVNFTYRRSARFTGDPRGLFLDLVTAQLGPWDGGPGGGPARPPAHGYAAYLDADRHAVCCASPELFFATTGSETGPDSASDPGVTVTCRPMKGTAPRGLGSAEDRLHAALLAGSAKERAENLMIVDMVRNDLGRIAEPGTVTTTDLFAVERYPTVLQMTSTVSARTTAGFAALFAALFPCASITGAPKASTSRLIAGLERGPRGVYTGAVGWLAPGGCSRFAVAIRTAVVDRARGRAEYGAGGGIVWDSRPAAELAESRLKARILPSGCGPRPAPPPFALLETLRWQSDSGWLRLAGHLERLQGSAEYFGFAWDEAAVLRELQAAVPRGLQAAVPSTVPGTAELPGESVLRVRLLLAAEGAVSVETAPLPGRLGGATPEAADRLPAVPVAFAAHPIDPDEPFLYHKTTRRKLYESALQEARRRHPEIEDVLLWSRRGGATESSIANLVVESEGVLTTPPLAAGLLPGVLRAELLATGSAGERRWSPAGVAVARRAWLVSSLRGWRRVRWVGEPPPAAAG